MGPGARGFALTPRIVLGIVGAPHGVRGEVRVKSFTARPAAIGDYGPLGVEGRTERLVVRAVRPIRDDMLVVRFEGVASRDAAIALRGARLSVERAALPAAAEEEFYHADLIGLRVEGEEGAPLGHVRAVVNYGGGDLLEIAGEGADTRLVAFTRAFVPTIDLAGGRLVVASDGLTDDAAPELDAPE